MRKIDRKKAYLVMCENIDRLKEAIADLSERKSDKTEYIKFKYKSFAGTWLNLCLNLTNLKFFFGVYLKIVEKFENEEKASLKEKEEKMSETEKKYQEFLKKNN